MNKTVNDLKTDRESIKKTHTKGILGTKSLGTETGTTEARFMNRLQVHLTLIRIAMINAITQMTAQTGKDVEWGNFTPPLLLGVQTCTATMEMGMVVPEKDGNPSTFKT